MSLDKTQWYSGSEDYKTQRAREKSEAFERQAFAAFHIFFAVCILGLLYEEFTHYLDHDSLTDAFYPFLFFFFIVLLRMYCLKI